MAASTTKVRVPQADGEIRISRDGDDPAVYKVSDHVTTVKADDLDHFLAHVEGSKTDGTTSPAPTQEK